jgi:acyl-CoA dehydrogenase
MDFGLTDAQLALRDEMEALAARYDGSYWRDVRADRRFPTEFYADLADAGVLGLVVPEAYGGAGRDVADLIVALDRLGEAGAWIGALSVLAGPVFGGYTLRQYGTEAQCERYLPALVDGEETWALGVTEADAGLNTANIATTAERTDDGFVVNGGKQYISGLDHADRLLFLARTTSADAADGPLDGLTMFVADADAVAAEEIPLDVYYPERVYDVTIDDLYLPAANVLGSVDDGLAQLLPTLNLERVAIAACSWGAGRSTLDAAVERAREREVWSEPIGAHQAIQHPLADAHADLEVARLALREAAWELDRGADSRGSTANVANLKACEAAWNACEAAMTTFGGSSVGSASGVAAAWGFVRHTRSVPVSEEMIRNFVATHELDLPRSY